MKYRLIKHLLGSFTPCYFILNSSSAGLLTSLIRSPEDLLKFVDSAKYSYRDDPLLWSRYTQPIMEICIAEAETLEELIHQAPWIFI